MFARRLASRSARYSRQVNAADVLEFPADKSDPSEGHNNQIAAIEKTGNSNHRYLRIS